MRRAPHLSLYEIYCLRYAASRRRNAKQMAAARSAVWCPVLFDSRLTQRTKKWSAAAAVQRGATPPPYSFVRVCVGVGGFDDGRVRFDEVLENRETVSGTHGKIDNY